MLASQIRPALRLPLLAAAALALGLLAFATPDTYAAGDPALLPASADAQAVAVVELYTSEGCSSCPPADALLDALGREAQAQGVAVYPLAFHVDYWNYIGWTDPYSDASWSARQRAFAASRGSRRIYTPQMVVNGQTEFVGSSAREARAALADALSAPAPLTLHIKAVARAGQQITVAYQLDGQAPGARVQLALTEGGLTSKIDAGENDGRTLTHAHVVRAFAEAPAPKTRGEHTISATLPAGIDPTKTTAVLYVREGKTWRVLAAAAQPAKG